MADETFTPGQDDPADYTVDQVNAGLEGADQETVDAVLAQESDGEARKGILEGPHATTEPSEPSPREKHQDAGVLGDTAPDDDEFKPKTVAEAADDQDLDQNAKGYVGTVSDEDNRPDLSVAGVTGKNQG